jgi:small-conductance mechanosensitive channel
MPADVLIALLFNYALMVATCLAGVFIYWHLHRINKPVMARLFWLLAFLYTLLVFWRPIAAAIENPSLLRFVLGLIAVCVLAVYMAVATIRPKRDEWDDDDDEDDHDDFA